MTTKEIFNEAQGLFIKGKTSESIKRFTEALKAGYDSEASHMSRGAAYLTLNEHDNAIKDFDSVIQNDTTNERAFYYRGTAYLAKGNYTHALEDLDHAIELNPGRGITFFARAISKAELGKEKEAAEDFKTAMLYADVEIQKFADNFGILRTKFEKYFALLEGERGPTTKTVKDADVEKIRQWLEA
jgi:tetratricopeptide (TPR) repeat protein